MKTPVSVHKAHLDSLYTNTSFYVALFDGSMSTYGVTVSLSNPTRFLSNSHNLVAGNRIKLSVNSGGSLPTGFNNTTEYYVVNSAENSFFELSATKGGSPIAATTTGTGSISAVEQDLDIDKDTDMDIWIRHEVDYWGSSRQLLTFAAAKTGIQSNINMAYTDPTPVVFQPTTASIIYRYAAIIRNGNSNRLDNSGQLDLIEDYVSAVTIAQNTPKGIAFVLRKYSI
jgi:hypothetical protein